MVREIVRCLTPYDSGIYVDGTFGAGGHSVALLEAANCQVFGIDRDREAIKQGTLLKQRYSGRLRLIHGCFSNLESILSFHGVSQVNGIALDLGVSSMQLDRGDRGFSFQKNGPLDMRMDCEGKTAADLVNTIDEKTLATLIRNFGEERYAIRIAREIISSRSRKPITTTEELSFIISNVLGARGDRIHPATRTFQALRIAVNNEQEELKKVLTVAERILAPGARFAVVSFHSLEDRLVKRFFSNRSGKVTRSNRYYPPTNYSQGSNFRIV